MEWISRVLFTPQHKSELGSAGRVGSALPRLRGRSEDGARVGYIGFWRSTGALCRRLGTGPVWR